MSATGHSDDDRWVDLQIERVLFGLTQDEQAEYETLATTQTAEQPGFERVVASIDVAWSDSDSMPLPDHLREAIRDRAIAELSSQIPNPAKIARTTLRGQRSSPLPWMVAAVCLAVTLLSLIWRGLGTNVAPDPAQLRRNLIASAEDLIELNWSAGPTPIAGAEGDVVWSPRKQQGFLRFRGLPVNDPDQRQYQLWIFDRNQDEKTPVDGGVFDINSDGEVIVPIRAKLRVAEAYLFAVTIEKPGGVVVSSRERLPLLAIVKKS